MFFLASHGYRCIAHDRRGHGRSGQPWGGNDMDKAPGSSPVTHPNYTQIRCVRIYPFRSGYEIPMSYRLIPETGP